MLNRPIIILLVVLLVRLLDAQNLALMPLHDTTVIMFYPQSFIIPSQFDCVTKLRDLSKDSYHRPRHYSMMIWNEDYNEMYRQGIYFIHQPNTNRFSSIILREENRKFQEGERQGFNFADYLNKDTTGISREKTGQLFTRRDTAYPPYLSTDYTYKKGKNMYKFELSKKVRKYYEYWRDYGLLKRSKYRRFPRFPLDFTALKGKLFKVHIKYRYFGDVELFVLYTNKLPKKRNILKPRKKEYYCNHQYTNFYLIEDIVSISPFHVDSLSTLPLKH